MENQGFPGLDGIVTEEEFAHVQLPLPIGGQQPHGENHPNEAQIQPQPPIGDHPIPIQAQIQPPVGVHPIDAHLQAQPHGGNQPGPQQRRRRRGRRPVQRTYSEPYPPGYARDTPGWERYFVGFRHPTDVRHFYRCRHLATRCMGSMVVSVSKTTGEVTNAEDLDPHNHVV